MEGAIGALFFLLAVAAIAAICYRHRESLNDWLNGRERQPADPKLAEFKAKVKDVKAELSKYQRRLRLQSEIKAANEELNDMDKAETGEG